MASELGYTLDLVIESDNSACLAVTQRRGLGKLRHMEIRQIWLQDEYRAGRIGFRKIGTKANIADMLTKPLPASRMQLLAEELGLRLGEEEEEEDNDMDLDALCVIEQDIAEDVAESEATQDSGWFPPIAYLVAHVVLLVLGIWKAAELTWQMVRRCYRTCRRTGQMRYWKWHLWLRHCLGQQCRCGLTMEIRVMESGPHAGWAYVSCPKHRGDYSRCEVFRWL